MLLDTFLHKSKKHCHFWHHFFPAIVKLERISNIRGSWYSLLDPGDRLLSNMLKFKPRFTWSRPLTTAFKWNSNMFPGHRFENSFQSYRTNSLGSEKRNTPQMVYWAMYSFKCIKMDLRILTNTDVLHAVYIFVKYIVL